MMSIGTKIDEVRIDGDFDRLKHDLLSFAHLGLAATEIPVHGLDAIKNGRLDRNRLRRTQEILGDFDFTYSVHAPNPLNLMDVSHNDLHISVMRASLEFASAIGAGILVYHPGRFVAEESFAIGVESDLTPDAKKELLHQEADLLRSFAAEFPDIVICMENARPYLFHSPYCYAEQPHLLREQVVRIDRHNVRINLDVGHLHMAARFYDFDPVAAAADLGDLIAHTHIHDNFGTAIYHYEKQQTHQLPFGKGDLHMPVCWGEIPIRKILSTFLPSYRGMIMMELRSRYFSSTGESRDNLAAIVRSILQEKKGEQTESANHLTVRGSVSSRVS